MKHLRCVDTALPHQAQPARTLPTAECTGFHQQHDQHDYNNIVEQEKGGYVTHHERLLGSIARQLWPLLGITAPVADALWAWVHFREVRPLVDSASSSDANLTPAAGAGLVTCASTTQMHITGKACTERRRSVVCLSPEWRCRGCCVQFTVNGDRNLLATAEAGVGRILQHAAEPPPKELWDSPIPPDEANFGLEVLSYHRHTYAAAGPGQSLSMSIDLAAPCQQNSFSHHNSHCLSLLNCSRAVCILYTQVAASICEWICERLSDYHNNFSKDTSLMRVCAAGLCERVLLLLTQAVSGSCSRVLRLWADPVEAFHAERNACCCCRVWWTCWQLPSRRRRGEKATMWSRCLPHLPGFGVRKPLLHVRLTSASYGEACL